MVVDQEQAWVMEARRGSEDAFAKIVEAYQIPVYNLAYRMLGSPVEAEDAAQETFLRAYTRLDTYDPARKFSSWILSIASHFCVDKLRRRHGGMASMEEIEAQRWVPDETPRPEEQTLQQEQAALTQRLLQDLPESYRLVIVLRYWQDQSYEEIAEMTQSSVSAVKSRLHRARGMLGQKMQEEQEMRARSVERRQQDAVSGGS